MEVTAAGVPCAPCAVPGLEGVDGRLSRRYEALCLSHLSEADRLAAGLHSVPSAASGFAATQAAWRFLHNEAVTLPVLAGPLLECARAGAASACEEWVLVALDWCNLHFNPHPSKAHRVALSRRNDLGYELLTALAVSDRDGSPLAPLCLELRAADGVHSTRSDAPLEAASVLDSLAPVMGHARGTLGAGALSTGALGAGAKAPVFVIDAQADSVGHFRRWSGDGHRFLVRADARPRVSYDSKEVALGDKEVALGDAADLLKAAGAFAFVREAEFEGKPARQFVAEAPVTLARPARTHRVDKATGKPVHKNVPGDPLPLRLVVTELRDEAGTVLARWLLLTNLPPSVPAATVALWYYWRWRVEGYHKLLKGAGQQVERWQQQTPAALARRLAVAAMACVLVWRLARDKSPEAARTREALVKLSGRQMKRGEGRPGFTEPALLAGLGVLIPVLLLLEDYDLDELRAMTEQLLPGVLKKPAKPRQPGKVV